MLHKTIYHLLRQDDTDSSSVTALGTIQSEYPSIADLDGLEYTYKSLKTLLGDSSSEWAKNKIFYERYRQNIDNFKIDQASFPYLDISVLTPWTITPRSDMRELSADIRIAAYGDADESSSIVRNLILRVRNLLTTREGTSNFSYTYCADFLNYSVTSIRIDLLRIDQLMVDLGSIIFKMHANLIY